MGIGRILNGVAEARGESLDLDVEGGAAAVIYGEGSVSWVDVVDCYNDSDKVYVSDGVVEVEVGVGNWKGASATGKGWRCARGRLAAHEVGFPTQQLHIGSGHLHPVIEGGRGVEAEGRVQSIVSGGWMRGHVMMRGEMRWDVGGDGWDMQVDASRRKRFREKT